LEVFIDYNDHNFLLVGLFFSHKMKFLLLRTRLLVSLVGGIFLGALIAVLSPGVFWVGWLSATILSCLSLFGMLSAWHWVGGGKLLGLMMAMAFLLRLGTGVFMTLALPELGYNEEQQDRGYAFTDAFRRDNEAWGFTLSSTPLGQIFLAELDTDQYGGLLVLSGILYRYLSPDAHRQLLILILGAFFAALGVPFFRQAVGIRWNYRLANLATWILVLYPDGVLFGSSQMREPFLTGFICILIWGVVFWPVSRRSSIISITCGMVGMMTMSSRITLAVIGIMAIWFWMENMLPKSAIWQILGWVGLAVGGILVVYFGWLWLRSTASWDILLTERNSGRVQTAISELAGGKFGPQFITLYGLAQPVLPAAITEPALAIWKTTAIIRAVGWYAIAPILLYSFFAVWKVQPGTEKRILVWVALFVFVWIVVSSARAGGDQWDNPRYRSVFLPWIALLGGWGLLRAVEKRAFWLVRWLIVAAIFLAFFTNWYLSRYYKIGSRLPFWEMIAFICGFSSLVLVSGGLWSLFRSRISRLRKKSRTIG
jgi:hypothetical protein